MPIRIIADDACATASIDEAVGSLLSANRLDGIAAFATFREMGICQSWKAQGAEVGIHLNMSSGSPVLASEEIPTLTDPDSGGFWNPLSGGSRDPSHLLNLYARDLEQKVDPFDLRNEFEAQLALYKRSVGKEPDFVSVHHDLDTLEFVRHAAEQASGKPTRQSRILSGELVAYRYRLHPPDATLEDIVQYLCSELRSLETSDSRDQEIICHPAIAETDLESMTIYSRQRLLEHGALMDDRVANELVMLRGRST